MDKLTQKIHDISFYSVREYFLLHIFLLIVVLLSYVAIKPLLKSLLTDVIGLPIAPFQNAEPYLFTLLIAVWIFFEIRHILCKSTTKYLISQSDENKDNIERYDKETLDTYYESQITRDLYVPRHEEYQDIPFQRIKTVYSIVGNWRAGKTTASGYIIKKINTNEKLKILGEYYHDTFNFGNIDESIKAFFNEIADMTEIKELKKLGLISTPETDMSLSFGPITINQRFSQQLGANKLRKIIYDRLTEKPGCYVVIIDDIDRLTKDEQIQWLRTIELLGKFEQRFIIIVPVNDRILEANVESNLISKRYLDKILPHKMPIGVDIKYIRDQFGLTAKSSKTIKRKYAKYLYALALRIAIIEHQIKAGGYSAWRAAFDIEEISSTARALSAGLSYDTKYNDYGIPQPYAQYGAKKQYELDVQDDQRILINIPNAKDYEYQNFFGTQIAQYKFSSQPRSTHNPSGEESNQAYLDRTINFLTNSDSLEELFSNIQFKHSIATHDTKYTELKVPDCDYWLEFAYPIVKDVNSDHGVRKFFTYDIIRKEVAALMSVDSIKDETDFLVSIIRNGDTAI